MGHSDQCGEAAQPGVLVRARSPARDRGTRDTCPQAHSRWVGIYRTVSSTRHGIPDSMVFRSAVVGPRRIASSASASGSKARADRHGLPNGPAAVGMIMTYCPAVRQYEPPSRSRGSNMVAAAGAADLICNGTRRVHCSARGCIEGRVGRKCGRNEPVRALAEGAQRHIGRAPAVW